MQWTLLFLHGVMCVLGEGIEPHANLTFYKCSHFSMHRTIIWLISLSTMISVNPSNITVTSIKDIVFSWLFPSIMLSCAPWNKNSACDSKSPQASASFNPSIQYCLQSANSCSTLVSGSGMKKTNNIYYLVSNFMTRTYIK